MSVFDAYACYYDLLYKDKDYEAEADYVDRLIQAHAPGAKRLLELGCGTGKHADIISRKGYTVHAVDRSEEMLRCAAERFGSNENVRFSQGDMRGLALNEEFDTVISLFHVMSYQVSNDDLTAAFNTVAKHLKRGGVFVFDVWFGPAVLTERPSVRVKRLEDERIAVVRVAEPEMHPESNTVDVNYIVFITDKSDGKTIEVKETHRMRYVFKPEIELLAHSAGFELVHGEEWLTGRNPGFDTWGVCWIARKR